MRNNLEEYDVQSMDIRNTQMAMIHETAIVDPTASIHDGAVIGPYCVIGPDVEIGEGTTLQNHVTVQCLSRIGKNNMFYPFAVIGADPQDKKFEGERKEAAEANAMSALESKTLDSKIEMDILDALDEIKAYNERHERVDRSLSVAPH